ncbi:MAG: hypothetical protein QOI40_2644, partial [Alphaproteobacteria bacterium]|nr:hypothetical protein [Alphaproteobacteria bacterium]
MEGPYALDELRRRPPGGKKLAEQTRRSAARHASRVALLPPLPKIPDVDLVTPGSPKYDQYLPAANLRTTLHPALRAI